MAANIGQFTSLGFLLLSSVLLTLSTPLSGAADSISSGQSLSGNQTISSKNGTFELGFFQPGSSSRNWYLAVRFKSIPVKTIVWVANREAPLSDPASSEVRLSLDGQLVLLNQSKLPVWSSNSPLSTNPNSTAAVLLDTGNLVLRDGSAVLWQSFDHPGDTLLPGAKIGFNGTEGKSWKLVSWKNREDPSPGLYSLELDPSGGVQAVIRRNETQTYWSSGAWDGHIFSSTPEMMALHEYSIDPFFGPNATYFTYSDHEVGGLSTMWMDVSGQWMWQKWTEDIQQWNVFSFMPRDPCNVSRGCGPFGVCTPHATPYCDCQPGFEPVGDWGLGDTTGGCGRKSQLQCGRNGSAGGRQKDGFLQVANIQLPSDPLLLTAATSEQECEQACSDDCSCTAYAYGSGCSVWRGGLFDVQLDTQGQSGDLFLRLAASELPPPSKKKTALVPALVGALAGTISVLLVVSLLLWRRRRARLTAKALAEQGFLVPFRYRDLQRTTKNFSDKLGKGGFGSVFKGTLPDSSLVAVKKLEGLRQGDKQFRMEVAAMASVQHVNVVRLRGFCCEGAKRLLVYDYMPNGSLDSYLYPKSLEGLAWCRRFQVAVGAARGLAYLHEKCRECVIHCDVKPENILLDGEFQPKVADFGMAKLVGRDFSRVLTTMRGTLGYLAPEWISGVPITPKADVYSYGMMLFEIVSGRRNGEEPEEGRPSFFPAWAAQEVDGGEGGESAEFQDYASSEDPAGVEELRRACKVACWCIQDEEGDRPSMGQVVQMLEGVVEVGMPPVPKLLQNHVASGEEIVFILERHSFASSKASSSGVSSQS